jgi:hypothetical protein
MSDKEAKSDGDSKPADSAEPITIVVKAQVRGGLSRGGSSRLSDDEIVARVLGAWLYLSFVLTSHSAKSARRWQLIGMRE